MIFPKKIFIVLSIITLLYSCVEERNEEQKPDARNYNNELIEANRHVVKTEAQHIDDFLKRYKWDVTETGSGLRYWIYDDVEGLKASINVVATIEYSVKLITGDMVYSSEQDGLLSFLIGKGEVISGLEEGILLMDVGDKAKFIIPSHLAYGLVGDDNRIPGKATLIYDVKLLEINNYTN
jgi:FKBP-type peptidyl-prolyl cis-trans isomerase FkpA